MNSEKTPMLKAHQFVVITDTEEDTERVKKPFI